MKYDVIVVGSGYAGSVTAHKFAQDGKKVLIIERRDHIGGNMYDYIDENGVNYHKYGPHIFHTNSDIVVEFLSQFTEWYPYEHRVLGKINNQFVPIPFNLKSIEMLFEEDKAERLKKILIDTYGMETKVPILELRKNDDDEIKELAEFIYEKVFLYYTMKQWDLSPEEIDPAVTGRVPVHISYDDRYFQDKFQNMPKDGYTKIFERMLNHENIDILLNTDRKDLVTIDLENKQILYKGEVFDGKLVYTGAIDELFDYHLGKLPYRSLDFVIETHDDYFQGSGTVNYNTPKEEDAFTRITEYKHMMNNPKLEKTTIAVEYSYPYDIDAEKGNIPYYPIFTDEIKNRYDEYVKLTKEFNNLHLIGRLAQFRYYNMDGIVEAALKEYENIKFK
jgi:UDP-galactopyranose mutase